MQASLQKGTRQGAPRQSHNRARAPLHSIRIPAAPPVAVSVPCSADVANGPGTFGSRKGRRVASSAARRDVVAQASSQQVMNYQMSTEEEEEYPVCNVPFVSADNAAHEKYTVLTIDVTDYPGLLRTLAWVLNGMGMRVQHAIINSHDGMAKDTLWLSTWQGHKLTDKQAALTAERVQDFVVFCEPKKCVPTEWACQNVRVSNIAHPKWTVLTVEGEPKRPGFLLELASVLTGTGTNVQEGFIQSEPVTNATPSHDGTDGDASKRPTLVSVAPPDYDFSKGRYFQFLLSDTNGNKLGPAQVGAILFTYDVFTDRKHMPLVAPNMDTYLKSIEQGMCK